MSFLRATVTRGTKQWAKSGRSQRAWCAKKPRRALHAVSDEESRPLDDADDSGARLHKVFEAHADGDQDHSCETILTYVQIAPDFYSGGR